MTPGELRRRTWQSAVAVIGLARPLLRDPLGRVIGGQLIRCAGSVGANYRAACQAKSRADFVSKMGTVAEEADESAYWLSVAVAVKLLTEASTTAVMREADELTAIAIASLKTARRNRP